MSFNREITNFTLSSLDIYRNKTGYFNNSQNTSFTFTNVNLRSICGEMWNKYDYFNITLVGAVSGASTAAVTDADSRGANIVLSGLQFISTNMINDTTSSYYGGGVLLGNISLNLLYILNMLTPSYARGSFTFRKDKDVVNLRFDYLKSNDNTPLNPVGIRGVNNTGDGYPTNDILQPQVLFLRIDPVDRDNMYQYPDKPDPLTGGQPRMKIF